MPYSMVGTAMPTAPSISTTAKILVPNSSTSFYHYLQALADDLLQRQILHVHALQRHGHLGAGVAQHRQGLGCLRRLAGEGRGADGSPAGEVQPGDGALL